MAGIKNGTLVGKNADFTQDIGPNSQSSESNGLVTDGKLWIGSTAVNAGNTHINVGSITSPLATLSIGYSSPNITLDISGGAPTCSMIARACARAASAAACAFLFALPPIRPPITGPATAPTPATINGIL